MTFNNWKELSINGIKLKKLVRASDGLVLFELPSGPDYSEPFWVKGTYEGAGNHSAFVFAAKNDPTPLSLEYSTDKMNWTPLEFYYDSGYVNWQSVKRFSTREVNKIYFRSGSETPVNPGDFTLQIKPYQAAYYRPFIIGGNLHSFLCKDFKDITDLSGMLSCFNDFLSYGAFADAKKLLLPAKVIGDYGYRRLFVDSLALSATPKMSFDVEEIGKYGMAYTFYYTRSFKGHLAFTSLKSVGPYGMYNIGNDSRLSSIEFPENQISVNYYGMNNLAKDDTNLKNVNHINVVFLSGYTLTRAFEGCTSLETVGGLSCYNSNSRSYTLSGMFNNCSSLVDVGDLNIDLNGTQVCKHMFNNCTSLSAVRGLMKLRGQRVAEQCFLNSGIRDVSQLSIQLGDGSYNGRYMFDGCSNLESMPVFIPDLIGSGSYKYQYAFRNCTNLKQVTPLVEVIPQSNLYAYAFQNCTSMTDAPEIMLSSINSINCMANMFNGCTRLSSVTVHFTSWPSTVRTTNWMLNVAPTGIFRCPAELEDRRGVDYIPEGWTVERLYNGLCFKAEEDNSTIGLIKTGSPDALTLQTSYDGATWTDYNTDDTISLTQGQKVFFRNKNTITQISKSSSAYWQFGMTGKIAASGNINSLLTPDFDTDDVALGEYCFNRLFYNCTSLTSAPELPATTVSSYSYSSLFSGCTSLVNAPELPATTVSIYSYSSMFFGCTSLVKAPELPATTVSTQSYNSMFNGCTSLTQAPALPATTLGQYSYRNMFNGCTSLVQAPELPATELGQYCYMNMFTGCTSLTQAPELPATILKISCYANMFKNCTALTRVPKIAASTSYATGCMTSMFNGCSSLAYIEVDMTTWPATSQMANWVTGVGKVGTFKCPQELPEEHANNRIPVGWTIVRK